jgi:hypothetical protein
MTETDIIAKLSKEAGRDLTAELSYAPLDVPTQIDAAASQSPKCGTFHWMMRYWAEHCRSLETEVQELRNRNER